MKASPRWFSLSFEVAPKGHDLVFGQASQEGARKPIARSLCLDPASARSALLLASLVVLSGCETQSAVNVPEPPEALDSRSFRIEACQDRTGLGGGRGLAAEGTAALTKQLQESHVFDVSDDADLMLSCDIERYIEGSAFKRWLLPGWGATEATVKVAIWRMPENEILATFQSKAAVRAGGLYTIGAEDYIVDVAIRDVVEQMEAWVAGGKTEGAG